MVRIRVKPIESRGSYRVNKIAWSEKVYRVASAESGEMEARFGLEGWPEKVARRDLREAAWWEAAGPSERPQGRERPRPSTLHASESLGGSHDSLKRLRATSSSSRSARSSAISARARSSPIISLRWSSCQRRIILSRSRSSQRIFSPRISS